MKKDKKIFISTTTFCEYSSKPINLLNKEGFSILLNKLGRKLTSNEVYNEGSNSVGIIAGTENYTKDTFQKLRKLKV